MHVKIQLAIGWPKVKWFGAKIKQPTVLPVCALRFADFLWLCYHLERVYAQSAFLFLIVFIFSPMFTLNHFFDFGSALGRSPSFRYAHVVPLCGHTYRFGLRHTAPPVQMRIMKELSVNFNQIGFSTSKITICRKKFGSTLHRLPFCTATYTTTLFLLLCRGVSSYPRSEFADLIARLRFSRRGSICNVLAVTLQFSLLFTGALRSILEPDFENQPFDFYEWQIRF